ncbi:MAG: hypothetical protein JRF40_12515, partial [Deltaproteobacteria bacterium]|nr:hypothetical protein [Deltaproteobacteria bacterium]
DTTQLRLGTYTVQTGGYIECNDGMPIIPGRSYWFLSRNNLDVDVSGIQVATDLDVEIALQYNTTSGNGWNMIACPNAVDYDWSSVQVLVPDGSGGTTFGPTDISDLPEDNSYIDIQLWRWENGAYQDDTQTMTHHEGYWVNARTENIYLRFRADMAIADSGQNRTVFAKALYRAKNRIKNQAKKWFAAITDIRQAVASGETPPLPPGVHDEPETEKSGCFINVAAKP